MQVISPFKGALQVAGLPKHEGSYTVINEALHLEIGDKSDEEIRYERIKSFFQSTFGINDFELFDDRRVSQWPDGLVVLAPDLLSCLGNDPRSIQDYCNVAVMFLESFPAFADDAYFVKQFRRGIAGLHDVDNWLRQVPPQQSGSPLRIRRMSMLPGAVYRYERSFFSISPYMANVIGSPAHLVADIFALGSWYISEGESLKQQLLAGTAPSLDAAGTEMERQGPVNGRAMLGFDPEEDQIAWGHDWKEYPACKWNEGFAGPLLLAVA